MMRGLVTSGLFLKGAALLVFLAMLGGATYGVQSYMGADAFQALALQVDAPREILNATPGHDVTFPLVLANRGDTALTASARIVGPGIDAASAPLVVPARGNATAFVKVSVPPGAAAGNVPLAVQVLDSSGDLARERPDLLTLRVLGPAVGFQSGDVASVRYTGRIEATGKLFDSNDPAMGGLNVPQTEEYSPSTSAFDVEYDAPGVIPGFFEALRGMQPGESRSVTFPPEKGYGGPTEEESLPRNETLEREFVLELRVDAVARDTFDQYVAETGQGSGTQFAAGDIFRFEQGPNRWPYRIVTIDDERVEYTLQAEAGQAYTLFPFWEGGSEVVRVTEASVVFYSTPTTAIGEAFTMQPYWPDMSAIQDITNETIVVRHTPTIGLKFTIPASQFQAAREATVMDVTDDGIVVAVASAHPLAGQTLTFDIEVLSISR